MKYQTLLFEIGAEEIPAGYIAPALAALAGNLLEKLKEARIACKAAKTFGTPRRLAVMVDGVAEKQETVTTEMTGPPKSVGMDGTGNFTMAAEKFAQKAGVPVKSLFVIQTGKGEYLAARKEEKGKPAGDLLKEVKIDDPTPYDIKMNSKGNIYLTPVLATEALLVVPLDKYRIYKFTM